MVQTGLLDTVVAFTGLASSVLLVYAGLRLHRVESLLGRRHGPSLGIIVLALAQLAGTILPFAGGRVAYAAYLATSALYVAGIILLWPPYGSGRVHVSLPILYALGGDAAAFLASLYAYPRTRGTARVLLIVSGVSFLVRGSSLLLLPSPLGLWLLVAGETVRNMSLAVFSFIYTPVRRR